MSVANLALQFGDDDVKVLFLHFKIYCLKNQKYWK